MAFVGSRRIYVKSGGSWSTNSYVFAKDGGSFKAAKEIWVKNNGSWVQVTDSRPSIRITSKVISGSQSDILEMTGTVLTYGSTTTLASKRVDVNMYPTQITSWGTITPTSVSTTEGSFTVTGSGYGNDIVGVSFYIEATNSYGTVKYYF